MRDDTIYVRGYVIPSLTLDDAILGMERLFLDIARQATPHGSPSYDDFLVCGNVLGLLDAVREDVECRK